jgi:hypothetical protein
LSYISPYVDASLLFRLASRGSVDWQAVAVKQYKAETKEFLKNLTPFQVFAILSSMRFAANAFTLTS